jgi:hypothetical protein
VTRDISGRIEKMKGVEHGHQTAARQFTALFVFGINWMCKKTGRAGSIAQA